MLTRRNLARAAAALGVTPLLRPCGASAALPVPQSNAINCRVFRKGDDIGTAAYRFERQGTALTVRIAIDLVVKIGPIAVFRYTHRNVETWDGDTLTGFDAKTDDDGTPKFMSARHGPGGLMVTGSKTEPYVAPANALGTTYWNVRGVSGPLIDTEDGHLLKVKIAPVGDVEVALASGAKIPARQYAMTGELKLDLWYEPSDSFASMRYYAKDGSVVTYERL